MTNEKRPVVVTTDQKGVFFGYAKDTEGKTIRLEEARLCIYWDSACKGFMGLAVGGPTQKCRIGPAATITLRGITSVVECTDKAAEKWEQAPWGV